MVVPVNKVVRVQTIGADVIHAFAVPSFGIKIDAIPGRLNETWFKATREGIYYGQCSELCGKDHAFMPIEVRVVSEQAFAAWVEEAKKKICRRRAPPTRARSLPPCIAKRRLKHKNDKGRRIRSWQPRSLTVCTTHTARMARTRRTRIRPDGAASSIRRTTRTSARCTSCSRSSAA